METRTLGKTGLKVSVLGFGCGAVGGLMVRGEPADQERAVARALELGINYFDTAPLYGNGESEKNLGKVLAAALRPDVFVGTKVRVPQAEFGRIAEAVTASLEASLRRLGREQVDLLQLHNNISRDSNGDGSRPGLSGPRLRKPSGANEKSERRRNLYSGAGRGRSQWRRNASPTRLTRSRTYRFGCRLPCRRRTRAAARGFGAGGLCGQLDRGGAPFCDRT
jgi:hypothetical protein